MHWRKLPQNNMEKAGKAAVNIIMHIGIVIGSILLLLGVPFMLTGRLSFLLGNEPDAVSSASVILDKPSGKYYVLVNKALHSDEEKLQDWVTFFSGGEILYIFEDIACSVAASDAGGIDMANSFRSRLPEHQMQIKREDAALLASRADHGLYDVMILSRECADQYGILTDASEQREVIEVFVENETEAGGQS